MNRRRFLAAAGATGLAGVAGCNGATNGNSTTSETTSSTETTTSTPATGEVTLVHDTHFHGTYGDLSGNVNVATYFGLMDHVADQHEHALKIGNGDDLASSVLSSMFDGTHITDVFDAGGLDYDTYGNHDFDMGPDVLQKRVAGNEETTWVSANVTDSTTGDVFAAEQGAKRYDLVEMGDLTVGVTGLIHANAPQSTSMGDAIVDDLAASLNDTAATMRDEGADLVVVAAHVASPNTLDLAPKLEGVDAIVGDHAAKVFEEPKVVNDVIVSAVGDEFQYVGELTLTVEDGERTGHDFTLHETKTEVSENGVEADADVLEVAKSYESKLEDKLDVVIGETETKLDARTEVLRSEESNLGNYVSDVVRESVDADVAIQNGGGIRTDTLYDAGDITNRMVRSWLPFGNVVVELEVDGLTLLNALENGVSKVEDGSGRFPQVSGIEYAYDPEASAGSRITDATVGGDPIDPNATYTLGTNNYMASGGDGYEMLTDADRLVSANEGKVTATVVIDAIEEAETISPETEGRITVE